MSRRLYFLLSSLPDSWETLVVSISNSAPDGTISLDVIKESMFNEELRRKEMRVDISQALVVENRGRSKSRGPKGRGKSKYRSKSKDGRDPTICHYCSKQGHIQNVCYKLKRDHRNKKMTIIKRVMTRIQLLQLLVLKNMFSDMCYWRVLPC
uniref:CCHC-type domain-containing protein n=1 Tax=Solanum lycopersicum TaxID=4081 RepID=Q5GA70_SOLLC|nr:hypothetical protein [Solanum lycopersicum]